MTDFFPFTLSSPTGADLALRHMPSHGPARGIVQINHGLAEHAARYARFARVPSPPAATRVYAP